MERGMMGNYHVPCGVGEKLEITSNVYLLLTCAAEPRSYHIAGGIPVEKELAIHS